MSFSISQELGGNKKAQKLQITQEVAELEVKMRSSFVTASKASVVLLRMFQTLR